MKKVVGHTARSTVCFSINLVQNLNAIETSFQMFLLFLCVKNKRAAAVWEEVQPRIALNQLVQRMDWPVEPDLCVPLNKFTYISSESDELSAYGGFEYFAASMRRFVNINMMTIGRNDSFFF